MQTYLSVCHALSTNTMTMIIRLILCGDFKENLLSSLGYKMCSGSDSFVTSIIEYFDRVKYFITKAVFLLLLFL